MPVDANGSKLPCRIRVRFGIRGGRIRGIVLHTLLGVLQKYSEDGVKLVLGKLFDLSSEGLQIILLQMFFDIEGW